MRIRGLLRLLAAVALTLAIAAFLCSAWYWWTTTIHWRDTQAPAELAQLDPQIAALLAD